MTQRIPAVVLGGTGYVAGELLRLIAGHPHFELAGVLSESQPGEPVADAFRHLSTAYPQERFKSPAQIEQIVADEPAAAIFSAAPHGAAAALIDRLLHAAESAGRSPHVVDISADFRFSSAAAYEAVYRHAHGAPARIASFVCAVPEHLARAPTAHVAHPGCFATATLLASVPLLSLGITRGDLFVSAVTGSTGSGRKPQEGTHHPARHSDLYAYSALAHRHVPEIRACAAAASGVEAQFAFVPHSGPFARGIHATVQATLRTPRDTAEVLAAFREFYADAPFVRISETPPRVKDVATSNFATLSAVSDGRTLAVFCVLDNLNKGAAGGAVQWMNRLFELPETAGLTAPAPGLDLSMSAQPIPFLAPVFAQYPLPVVSASGVWLRTSDGRRVLDLYGGHAVAALGYGHRGWTQALSEQAQTLNFQSNAVPLETRLRAAQRLIRFSGLDFSSVFFVNSGAEANENALKMAFAITRRSHVAAIEHAFHGRTAATGAITWGAAGKWYGYPRTPFDVSFIARRDKSGIAAHVTDATAAVIVEPVQGVGGAYDMGADFLSALRSRCDQVGALLIFDEVQCGMGRVGESFAAKLYGIQPDMITAAKALGNGFPCAALLMSPRVAAAVKLDALGTTFGGGPMACAVIEAVIEAIESEHLLARVRHTSALIRNRCLVGPVIAHQGAGLLLGLRTVRPAKEIHAALLERNILAGTSADPTILRLLPPYVLEDEHVELLRSALLDIGG